MDKFLAIKGRQRRPLRTLVHPRHVQIWPEQQQPLVGSAVALGALEQLPDGR